MIIHERPDVCEQTEKPELNRDAIINYFGKISKKFTLDIMNFDKEYVYSMKPYGQESYKQENRDWEFILKDKYAGPDGTLRPVHDERGPFLPIEYNPETKKMTRPLENDPNRNEKMPQLLEEGYARFWSYFMRILKESKEEL